MSSPIVSSPSSTIAPADEQDHAWPRSPTPRCRGRRARRLAVYSLASGCSPTTLRWCTRLCRCRLCAVMTRMPDRFSWRSASTTAMRSRTARNPRSDACRNHSVVTAITGTTNPIGDQRQLDVHREQDTGDEQQRQRLDEQVERPSWKSWLSASMSLVMRVISRRPSRG